MWIAETIADAFADCGANAQDMVEDAVHDLGFHPPWLRGLAQRVLAQLNAELPHTKTAIHATVLADANFQKVLDTSGEDVPMPGVFHEQIRNKPKSPTQRWPEVPSVKSLSELAGLLGEDTHSLDWVIRNRKNYSRKWIRKRSSGLRLLEAPRPRLKSIQRKVLASILDRIPVHPAAHGFCKGRNVVGFAKPHAHRECVLKFDLKDFFPSLRFGRVMGIFQMAGYSEAMARWLTRLSVASCPGEWIAPIRCDADPIQQQQLRRLYLPLHLPQGAPTSPMLANLAAYRLDARLSGFAANRGATYTRYADDLLFSGGRELGRSFEWFASVVGAIVLEEGFCLNYRKSRLMRSSVRQTAAGIVLNGGTNIARDEFDRLKAILFNCVRNGPGTQNRSGHSDFRAHLAGKIAWVAQLNESRGDKLRKLFQQIVWDA
jgi:hypothetical protein